MLSLRPYVCALVFAAAATSAVSAAEAPPAGEKAEEGLVIAPRQSGGQGAAGASTDDPLAGAVRATEAAGSPQAKALLEKIGYYRQVAHLCKALAPSGSAGESERQAAAAELTRERSRAGEMLLYCLNPANQPDSATRLGALKAVELLKPSDPKISYALGAAAASDPAREVRSAAVSLARARQDDYAVRTMLGHLLASYDEAGLIGHRVLHDNAVGALRELGDKRVCQALLYYATLELRLTNVSSGSLATRQINSYTVNSGANANVVIPLSFPIQMPELNMTQVKTSVKAPAVSALCDVSGENFGENWDKWGKWVEKQK